MSLTLDTRTEGDVTILALTGDLRLGETCSLFRNTYRDLLKQGVKKLCLDLAGVEHLDSSGIGEIVGAHSAAFASGTRIKLTRPPEKVRNLLHITRLATVFQVYETEEEALAAFAKT
jgi:anti-sigma B factor antagonist